MAHDTVIDTVDQDYSDRKMDDKIYVFPDFFVEDAKLCSWLKQFRKMVGSDLDDATFDRLVNTLVQESLRANMTGETGSDAANAIIFALGAWLGTAGGEGIIADFDPTSDAKLVQHLYNMLMRLMELIHRTVSTRIHIGEDSVGIIAEVPEQIRVIREDGELIMATVMMKTIDLGLPVDPTREQFIDLMKDFQREIGQYVGQEKACNEDSFVYIGRQMRNGVQGPWGNPYVMLTKNVDVLESRLGVCMEFYRDVIEGLTDRESPYHWRKIADLYKQHLCCYCSDFSNAADESKFCHGHILAAIAMRIVHGAQSAGLPTAA